MAFPKIMTIAHAGGEYLSVNLSGLGRSEAEIDSILDKAKDEILKPSTNKNIGFQVYGTRVSAAVAAKIEAWLAAVDGHAKKVAVIGLSPTGKLAFGLKTAGKKYGFGIKKFFDIDESKDWLVGKRK